MRLIISQEQSWPSGLLYLVSRKWVNCGFERLAFLSGQNSQLAGQMLFYPDVSAGHFQKLFQALYYYYILNDRKDVIINESNNFKE